MFSESVDVCKLIPLQYVLEVLDQMSRETVDGTVTSENLAARILGGDEKMRSCSITTVHQTVVKLLREGSTQGKCYMYRPNAYKLGNGTMNNGLEIDEINDRDLASVVVVRTKDKLTKELPIKKYFCDCGKGYCHKHGLVEHQKKEHMVPKPVFICPWCGKRSKTPWKLKSHIAKQHPKCSICNEPMRQTEILITNLNEQMHNRCYCCHLCKQTMLREQEQYMCDGQIFCSVKCATEFQNSSYKKRQEMKELIDTPQTEVAAFVKPGASASAAPADVENADKNDNEQNVDVKKKGAIPVTTTDTVANFLRKNANSFDGGRSDKEKREKLNADNEDDTVNDIDL